MKKIFLLDKDTVDYHNLNRQILFSKDDIGTSKVILSHPITANGKVEAAAKSLEKHNLRTEIVPMHMDVLTNWDKVVQAARECTVIFNMIDTGDYLDLAVQSLAKKLGIAFCIGGTFRSTITVDFITPKGTSSVVHKVI